MPASALSLVSAHDLALDCSDNAPTRYLISDACARARRPLVSGAAQGFSGQVCTYALGAAGPCYRCLFPRAPAVEAQGSCAELGILGAVAGVVGALQAVEAVKILTGMHDGRPSLLLYEALAAPPFRSVKLRTRRKDCVACGEAPAADMNGIDYVHFCGGPRPDWVKLGLEGAAEGIRVRAGELREAMEREEEGVCILDVRPQTEFGICRLPLSIRECHRLFRALGGTEYVADIPLQELVADPRAHVPYGACDIFVVCRLGNDSQIAADAIRAAGVGEGTRVRDLVGGLRAWAREVDGKFPVY
jgi:adenylyltransferase/sulfurtransferase